MTVSMLSQNPSLGRLLLKKLLCLKPSEMWVALGDQPMGLAKDKKMSFCAHVLKHSWRVQRRLLPSAAKEGFFSCRIDYL